MQREEKLLQVFVEQHMSHIHIWLTQTQFWVYILFIVWKGDVVLSIIARVHSFALTKKEQNTQIDVPWRK